MARSRPAPEWFVLSDEATTETMRRVADAVRDPNLPIQVKFAPMQAHWFILDSMLLANRANQEGMHANALAVTRQCIEALSILELGLTSHSDAGDVLIRWDSDKFTPGKLRQWLSENLWPTYGMGLWTEPWTLFMAKLAGAVQPYAHYTPKLAQWQSELLGKGDLNEPNTLIVRFAPRAYDPQKATRITLYHAILAFTLGRIWLVGRSDPEFAALIARFGKAIGKSRYLDGHETDWDQQFWAMVWSQGGGTILE